MYNIHQETSIVDTTISYDGLGRKTGMVDPDMGAWSYEYDPIGTIAAQTDAREMRTEYAYDRLGRLVRKWHRATWSAESITQADKPCVYDLMELRCAVDVNLASLGQAVGSWTDPAVVAGRDVPVRAVHFTELRDRIQTLWSTAGMGTLPQFSAGAISAGTRSIKTSDPLDLRRWLEQYEESGYGMLHRARACYEYDGYDGVSQFGRGRRTASWDATGSQASYYDRAGRGYKEERWIDGTLYTTRLTFDALGRGHETTLPDGEVISYGYGQNGLLLEMSSSLGVSLVSGVEYNVLGQPKRYTLGSGTTAESRYTYYGLDEGTYPFGAVKRIELQQGASPALVDREMTYDQAGNITAVNDRVSGENISYSYDDLDRLVSAGAPLGETFAYNQIGNMTSKNGVPYTYGDSLHVHAVTTFGSTAYSYDANGSMVRRAATSIRYDAERRPVRVAEGPSVLWRASYDGDGARRKRVDGKGTIHYLGGYERNVGNGTDTAESVTKYYRALGRLVAFRRNGTLYWVGTDHLGGTVRVASSSFSPIAQMRYMPYGASRDSTGDTITDYLFTSQQLDASVGLYWYGSRAYDPELGRFTCADTIVPSAGNPQSLNRYAYTYNNPLRYTDPTGHEGWDDLDQDTKDLFNGTYGDDGSGQAAWEAEREKDVKTPGWRGDGGGGDGGSALAASDGQTLSGQADDVRQLFQDVWGSNAGAQWARERDAAIGSRGGGDWSSDAGTSSRFGREGSSDAGTALPPPPPRPRYGPRDVDVIANIKYAETRLASPTPQPSGIGSEDYASLIRLGDFVNKVRPGGEWDYKLKNADLYDDFGNWHFGVVAAAAGFSEDAARRGAGLAQEVRNGLLKLAGKKPIPSPSNPLSGPPYGDDPVDQAWIQAGYEWYRWYKSVD